MKSTIMKLCKMILNKGLGIVIFLMTMFMTTGCQDNFLKTDMSAKDLKKLNIPIASDYRTVVLVADVTGFNAARIDANLKNPWGVAITSTGRIWIADNHTGTSVIYDAEGNQVRIPVNIPLGADPNGASPTGVILNGTPDFVIPNMGASLFIFATEDGIISAWNQSTDNTSVTVADRSAAGTVYKGIAKAVDGGANFIYATDFHNGKIDVFDKNFALVNTKPFVDPNIPAGFAPFNIVNIGGNLYVTYAKQLAPDNHDDQAGLGNGFVDIYTPGGILIKRFASQGMLNSPWGIAPVVSKFGQINNAILIGNFGDGHINVYDMDGNFQGQFKERGKPVTIQGLWTITFDNAAPDKLYFTAGPDQENHGMFGYIEKK
jgi:uncharacterized protein (TIGR03118 family)